MTDSAAETRRKRVVHRSPGYPMFSLKEAIDKAKLIYDHEKRSFTTPDVIAKHLGFSQHVGGPGGRAMSALRQYGLLEESEGKSRISNLAYTLLQYAVGSPERNQALRTAMRKPALFNELLIEYRDGLPSDDTLRSNLLQKGFNPEVIGDVVRIFRDTIALDSGTVVERHAIQLGDYVQWESQGIYQFEQPRRVVRISADGKFGFFDDSTTGAPVEQLTKVNPPVEEKEIGGKPLIKRIQPKPGMNNEVFTLSEGEVVLQWPNQMSPESYEDFKDWLELITRKAKRMVDKKTEIETAEAE